VNDGLTPLMVEALESGLSSLWKRRVCVRGVRRELLGSSSSFRTERLRVTLDRHKPLRVFFKDLNPDHQLEKARTVRELSLEPSLRELRMYRSVLSPERFGTLELYAARWEPRRGLHWLFLEDGGRTVLHNTLALPRWTAAARWAARFHAATRDLPAEQAAFLPRYDRAHYERCAERVRRLLPTLAPAERDLVTQGLDAFTARIEWLSTLPPSVIHGQLFGKNILLRQRRGTLEVVVIDWETAALGPGTFDLVSLTSGKWTNEQRRAMWSAYEEAYGVATRRPVDRAAFSDELKAVALYQSLEWLAWWGQHRALSRHFANFLKELAKALV
jgi:hypothetical protein